MDNKKSKKKRMSNKKFKRFMIIILSIVFVLTLAVNILINIFSGHADLFLGRGEVIITQVEGTENWDSEYYKSDFSSGTELSEAAYNLVESIEEEGIVLLKNNGILPLKTSASDKTRVTLFGRDSADPVYGGSGSGSVDLSSVVDFKSAMENADFIINEIVYDILLDYASYSKGINQFGAVYKKYDNPKANIIMDKPEESTYFIGEMPSAYYTPEAVASFAEYNDAAIIMFGRGGGEGGDLTKDMNGFDENYTYGQHQLELNMDEKDILELAKANFDAVIVIINSSSAMELGNLENDEEIDAVLWIGSPGQNGFNAVGKVIQGSITPSGRTADLYARDFTADPAFVNFGHYQYENIDKSNAIGSGYFVQYEEGLYYGYRFYETASAEDFIDYKEAVVYPFGYGLSYTEFSWEITGQEAGEINGEISVNVKVTNIGNTYSGKDVVQLYFSPPYYEGGIEKPEIVLGDFVKTGELAPGESETVTLVLSAEDMASYDYKNSKAYVLEAGDYRILLQTDSHNIKEGLDEIIYTVDKTIVYSGNNHRSSDFSEVTNRFDDVSVLFTDEKKEGYITNLSRSDFAGTFPTAPEEDDFIATDDIIAGYKPYSAGEHTGESIKMPVTGRESGVLLINLRGLDFDDGLWQALLDELKPEEIAAIVNNSAYNTAAIESISKPATVDLDGPAGINAFMGNIHGTSFPSAVVIASAFNKELAYNMGKMIGNEGLEYGVSGWYAPAVNLHRSPFAGRNFEYYSEDPVLSGKIGAAVISGAADKGVYSFVKHYALNDQETNRNNSGGISTWANEQVIREIYLKPFEIIVKTAKTNIKFISDEKGTVTEKEMNACTAIMSSFNRIGSIWAGGSYPLMQTVLRDEWGFRGIVISDFNLYPYMYIDQGMMAGTDINCTFESLKSIEDTASATAVSYLRKIAHRLLYTVVNSNSMNGIVPGSTISYTMAPWKIGLIITDIIITVLLILGVFYTMHRLKKEQL